MFDSTVQAANPRRTILMAGATAALAVAAMGFAGGAQARSDVQFSVGVVLPGAQVGVTNAYPVYPEPVYYPRPVYVQPQPVYYPPPPVYYQPRPVYHVRPPVYAVPAPVYYGGYRHRGYGHGHYRGHGGHRGHGGYGHGGHR